MKLNRLIQITTVMVVIFAFIGCDEDYSNIGGEVIDNPTEVELREVEVNAYSKKINSIQTNNLVNHFLGVNNNPIYGESVASIVTQLNLSAPNPTFGNNIELDSVVMTIPYYVSELPSDPGEEIEFELDSVYGSEPFKLAIYETAYFLNDLDPAANFEQRQKYYSDQQDIVEQNIIGEPLYVDENFVPSAETYTTYEIDGSGENDTIVNNPGLRVKLPTEFFRQKILAKEGSDVLLNNNNFENYFRSLLIKAEATGTGGSMIFFNLSATNSQITLYYTKEVEEINDAGEVVTVRERDAYDLIFEGNRFNTIKGSFPEAILQEINSQSEETGVENIYLKGLEGSMAVIELFEDQQELELLRENNWLINEANLTFYVDRDALTGELIEPERLLLYDLDNNTVITDYVNDPGVSQGNPLNSRLTFSPRLVRDEDGNGVYYKIRVTQHISNLLKEGAENVRLGLVVTGNINNSNLSAVRQSGEIDRAPASMFATPYGTVLYGDETSNEEKRLKLRIYYTDLDF